MKKLICVFALMALVVSTFGLTITWKPNPPEEEITNYKVWWAMGNGEFQLLADTGTTNSYTITNLPPGIYRFRLTAQNVWAESPPSGSVASPAPPTAPKAATTYILVGARTNVIVNLK